MERRPIDMVGDITDSVGERLSRTPISRIPGIGKVYYKLQEMVERRRYKNVDVPKKVSYRDKSLHVFPDSQWAKGIYIEGRHSDSEEYEWGIFSRHIFEGDVVFDVGAFVGTHSIMMHELVGPSGQVYAFEPQPGCAELIEKTFTENGMENCTVVNKAAGAENGIVELQTSRRGDATSNIVGSDPWDRHSRLVDVDTIRLDDFIEKKNISIIDFMKIDVQGAGLEVIQGLGEKLQDVDVIYMEIHSKYIDDTAETVGEIFNILNSCGDVIRLDTGERQVVKDSVEITFEQQHPDILWVQR